MLYIIHKINLRVRVGTDSRNLLELAISLNSHLLAICCRRDHDLGQTNHSLTSYITEITPNQGN